MCNLFLLTIEMKNLFSEHLSKRAAIWMKWRTFYAISDLIVSFNLEFELPNMKPFMNSIIIPHSLLSRVSFWGNSLRFCFSRSPQPRADEVWRHPEQMCGHTSMHRQLGRGTFSTMNHNIVLITQLFGIDQLLMGQTSWCLNILDMKLNMWIFCMMGLDVRKKVLDYYLF